MSSVSRLPRGQHRLAAEGKFGEPAAPNFLRWLHQETAARFFVNAAGRKPVREWILELPEADRYVIGKDIQKVEFGWPIGRPHCAPLGKGLWEVRSSLDGDRIARVIFCMGGGHMILLHGFVKKTQKTPPAQIALALKRMKEVT